MAGIKISALPPIVTPALTDLMAVVQAGVTYKETGTQLSALLSTVFLPLAGGTMTGTIIMGANSVRFNSGFGLVDQNGLAVIAVVPAATAVNYYTFTNSATGNPLSLTAAGTDTNIIFNISGKGTGGVQVEGTATNDSATAGYVGEFLSTTVAAAGAVAVTSGVSLNIATLSLTAGDWDVGGCVTTIPAAGTTTGSYFSGISIVSATLPTVSPTSAVVRFNNAPANPDQALAFSTGTCRISLAATTNVYLVFNSVFAVSTLTAYGWISGRRAR